MIYDLFLVRGTMFPCPWNYVSMPMKLCFHAHGI